MKLKVGAIAPDFTAKDQDGKTISLSQFKDKKVALYFYPQDDTPTCTVEACNLRDNFALLKKNKITVIGVSGDSVKSHKKFEVKYTLPFRLVADEERNIIDAYGVWGPKVLFGREYMGVLRTTFLVNKEGVIEHIIDNVKSAEHAKQILGMWKEE